VSRIVGRYEILDRLGEGGMADVYLARQLDLDRLVALKELRVLRTSDPAFVTRFLREARMAGSLSHPNIVTVHDYIENEGTPFIAMEYMDRGSLRPQIGRMTLPQIGGVLEGVLAGLDYAGQRGIVHRDIKPENVMIGSDGRVKIADFGIAKARDAFQTGGSLTAEGTALGTPNYMAPEQASADEVGTWTDIYAVGVMAFEMFIGRPPFADTPQPLVVIMRQVQDPIPRVTDLDPTIDPRIADWIAWLTAKDPSQRPQTASEAWDRFEEILVADAGSTWRRRAMLVPMAIAAASVPLGTTVASQTPVTQRLAETHLATTRAANPTLLGIDHTEAFGAAAAAAGGAEPKPRRKRRGPMLAVIGAAAAMLLLASGAFSRNSTPTGSAQPARATTSTPTPKKRQVATNLPADATHSSTTPSPAGVAAGNGNLTQAAAEAKALAGQYNDAAAKIEALQATGAQAGQNAILANLLRKTARGYSSAERAAARGDTQGYANGLADAKAAKDQLQTASAQAQAPAPAPTASSGGSGGSSGSSSSCAGDSQSDDPSDDSCGGEP
jgi:hypothetical protein